MDENDKPVTVEHITRNSAKCLECGDEIESTSVWDMQFCSCKSLAVDGGLEYRKRLYRTGTRWEETSVWTEETKTVGQIMDEMAANGEAIEFF